MHLSHKQQSLSLLSCQDSLIVPKVNGVPTGEVPQPVLWRWGQEGHERIAQDVPKCTALEGSVQASNYVSLPTPLSPLPPADPYVLSIYTQLVSSSAGFPGAVNEQKPGLYAHNNQLSFFCLLSPPPQAPEEWLWRKGHEFFISLTRGWFCLVEAIYIVPRY